MPRTRSLVAGTAVLVALVALVLATPVVWLELDSPPEPPVSALADLPDDALVTAIDKGCGSGGCWLEVSVDPGHGTPQELADEVAPGGTVCGFRSVVDLRRVCTWTSEVGLTDVRFSVMYDRYLDL